MIIMSLQAGCPASGTLLSPLYRQLNGLFKEYCGDPYSEPTEVLAMLLCVSGDIWQVEFEGPERLRRSRKHRQITLDIGFLQERWKGVPEANVRASLMHYVEQAVELFIKRLVKDKEPVRAADLRADLSRVREAFLADDVAGG